MKLKTQKITLALAAAMLSLFAQGQAKILLPVGEFEVTFPNGSSHTIKLSEDSTVRVSGKNDPGVGKAEFSEDKIIVRYPDDRVEHWTPADGAYRVEPTHPKLPGQNQQSQVGLAEKKLEGSLEVHEWGTFTILQGSDGQAIQWYQAPQKIVDLPPFVQPNFANFNKSIAFNPLNGLDSVRMETPVLYFYPEEPMDIRVSASFTSGRITEIFPPASPTFVNSRETVWRGRLLPPDSPEKSKVPAATGPKGRHYAAARNVPDAWLFSKLRPETKAPEKNGPDQPKPIAPIDHFIFYRGAGRADTFPIRAVEQDSPGTYRLSNSHQQTIPKLFALRVLDGQSSWTTIHQLDRLQYHSETKETLNQQLLTFPGTTRPVKEVAGELREAMVAALDAEGLTPAEARAMVATWDDLWFTEPGTRILALLPSSYADAMVPLQISPKPTKIERVFVARLELLNRAQEEILTEILDPVNGIDEKIASEKLAALKLGRYAAGGMARAQTLINSRIGQRFHRLEKLDAEKKDPKTASTR